MIDARSVAFAYDGTDAVRDVSLSIGEGELVALTGPNGSGKSTLLKLLARVMAPSRGDIAFEGKRLRDWPSKEYARCVGYLPQEPDPAFPMLARDVVLSGRAPFLGRFAWESDDDRAAANEALQMCDAAYLADRYLDEMSGGERKRIFLARVLAARPRLVLLDEPLTALDVSHVQQFSQLLRDIVGRTGCTVVYASHDLNWAGAYSDRMLVLQNGALAVDAPPRDVLPRAAELFGFDAITIEAGARLWVIPK